MIKNSRHIVLMVTPNIVNHFIMF